MYVFIMTFADERYRLLSSIPLSWFIILSFGVLVISSRFERWHQGRMQDSRT